MGWHSFLWDGTPIFNCIICNPSNLELKFLHVAVFIRIPYQHINYPYMLKICRPNFMRFKVTYFSTWTHGPNSLECNLEDLTVLNRLPDLLNNVKIGQDQLRLMKHILFYGGCSHFGQVTYNNLTNTPSNSPVISEVKCLDRYCGIPNEWPWIKGQRSAWHLVLI